MQRDLRDPTELGNKLLSFREGVSEIFGLSKIMDHAPLASVRDYASNLGPIEKYGRPQEIPSTMPNAVE